LRARLQSVHPLALLAGAFLLMMCAARSDLDGAEGGGADTIVISCAAHGQVAMAPVGEPPCDAVASLR